MIRFVDLRGQGTENRFAFFDTVCDRFLDLAGEHAWQTWDECEQVLAGGGLNAPLCNPEGVARLRGLCPPWAFEPDDGTHENRFWEGECTRRSPHAGPCNGWPCTWRAEQLAAEKASP